MPVRFPCIRANHLSTTLLQAAIAAGRERGLFTLALVRPDAGAAGVLPDDLSAAGDAADRFHRELVTHLQEILEGADAPALEPLLAMVRQKNADLQRGHSVLR